MYEYAIKIIKLHFSTMLKTFIYLFSISTSTEKQFKWAACMLLDIFWYNKFLIVTVWGNFFF